MLVVTSISFFVAAAVWIVFLGWDAERSSRLLDRLEGPLVLVGMGISVGMVLLVQNADSTGLPLSRRTAKVIVGSTIVVLLCSVGYVFGQRRYGDIDVEFGNPVDASPGMMTEIPVTAHGSPLAGGDLVFTASITRISNLGDCVLPATLTVSALADYFVADQIVMRSGEQGALTIPARSRRVIIKLTYNNQMGAECRVRISLTKGRLVR